MTRRRLPRVVQIERLCFGMGGAWTHEDFTAVLSQRSCIGMVATDLDDSTLGHMVYELHRNGLRLLNIAVDPLAQRDGAGAAMIAKLAGKMSAGGRDFIVTEVRQSNVQARLFLESMSFRVNRVHQGAGEKAIEYVLTLDNWVRYVNAAMDLAADLDREGVVS